VWLSPSLRKQPLTPPSPRKNGARERSSVPWLTSSERRSLLPHGVSTARLRNRAYRLLSQSSEGGMTMGQRIRPTAADIFASADLLRGILVVSSFGFWAV